MVVRPSFSKDSFASAFVPSTVGVPSTLARLYSRRTCCPKSVTYGSASVQMTACRVVASRDWIAPTSAVVDAIALSFPGPRVADEPAAPGVAHPHPRMPSPRRAESLRTGPAVS